MGFFRFCLASLSLLSTSFASEVYFPPKENGVFLTPPTMSWDLTQGETLHIGPKKFESSGFLVKIHKKKRRYELDISVPRGDLASGEVDVIDEKGEVIVKLPWKGDHDWTIFNESLIFDILKSKKFRVCLSTTPDQAESLIKCSPLYRVFRTGAEPKVEPLQKSVRPKVLMGTDERPLLGQHTWAATGKDSRAIKFTFLFSNGVSLQFLAEPREIRWRDIYREKEGTKDVIVIRGVGRSPLNCIECVRPRKNFWDATSGEASIEELWTMHLSAQDSTIWFPGRLELPFKHKIYWKKGVVWPINGERPVIKHSGSTYQGREKLIGEKSTGEKFEWNRRLEKKSHLDNDHLKIDINGYERAIQFPIYRGAAREVSARLSGMSAVPDVLLIGEVFGQAWFFERVGLFAQASYLVAESGNNTGSTGTRYEHLLTGGKIHIKGGVHSWKKTWGLMSAVREVTLEGQTASMFGFGGYWSGSWPWGLHKIFQWVPFIGPYEKWIEVEALYFPIGLEVDVLNDNFILNFRNKVQWSDDWFGEFLLTFNQIGFQENFQNRNSLLVQGTVGIGYGF